jgi:hypothetical protein
LDVTSRGVLWRPDRMVRPSSTATGTWLVPPMVIVALPVDDSSSVSVTRYSRVSVPLKPLVGV